MTILLPALAVAFAAFCIWLTVRIVNRRERWAKWTLAAMLGVPVLYVASFGPACWILARTDTRFVPTPYDPVQWLMNENATAESALLWYANVGTPRGTFWQMGHIPRGNRYRRLVYAKFAFLIGTDR